MAIGLLAKKKEDDAEITSKEDKGTIRDVLGIGDKDKIKSIKLKVKMK
jgi:hypothetical protein